MSTMTLVSFFDGDRSGKVRWLAHELGLELTEERITFQQTKEPGYLAESPFAVVPLLRTDGRTLRESTAIGHHLIETHGPHLGVAVGAPNRVDYLSWIATFAENLEQKLVECAVSKGGLLPPAVFEFNAPLVRKRLAQIAPLLPQQGFLLGEFTASALYDTLRFALSCWEDEEAWKVLQRNGMTQDFSWDVQGQHYVDLYRKLLPS